VAFSVPVGRRAREDGGLNMRSEIIVVGGGLAGACAAAHLARGGRAVTLLERDSHSVNKVCGEFLTAEACEELVRIGVDVGELGATKIERLRLVSAHRTVETRLPFAAVGLSRAVLDGAVRECASSEGTDVRMGARVVETSAHGVRLQDRTFLPAKHVIVATGKHDLRGTIKRSAPRMKDRKMGFKEHIRLSSKSSFALAGTVELHIFQGGYAGLLPLGEGIHNFSLTVSSDRWQAAGSNYRSLLDDIFTDNRLLASRLQGAIPQMDKPLAIGSVPYGYRVWQADTRSIHTWPVGDQTAVTPSLTGAGMALALASGRLVSEHLLSSSPCREAYIKTLRSTFSRQIAWARLFETALEVDFLRIPLFLSAGIAPGLLRTAAHLTRLPSKQRRWT